MLFILRCVPVINDNHCCILTSSLKTSTKIIGWVTLVFGVCMSAWYAMYLSQFQETEFRTPTEVSESKEFLIFKLSIYLIMVTLTFLLVLGVHCDVPVLMLPSLLVQLFLETSIILLHTMLFLVSETSDVSYRLVVVVGCVKFVGLVTFLWIVQYNCYRQFMEKRYCTCGEVIKAKPVCPECVMYHPEEKKEDYSALSAVFTMYALSMMNNEHSQCQC